MPTDKGAKGPEDWNDDGATRAKALDNSGSTGATVAGPTDDMDAASMELHLDQAARRAELTNRQTDFERETGRDAVSGTINPGITENSGHSQQGGIDSDMSGREAFRDPLTALDPEALRDARTAMQKAEDYDNAQAKPGNEQATRQSAGWRLQRDLGVHQTTLDALVKAGRVETGMAPGMHHHVDGGKLYRIKRDR